MQPLVQKVQLARGGRSATVVTDQLLVVLTSLRSALGDSFGLPVLSAIHGDVMGEGSSGGGGGVLRGSIKPWQAFAKHSLALGP